MVLQHQPIWYARTPIKSKTCGGVLNRWYPPSSSILIYFNGILHIHFGVPPAMEISGQQQASTELIWAPPARSCGTCRATPCRCPPAPTRHAPGEAVAEGGATRVFLPSLSYKAMENPGSWKLMVNNVESHGKTNVENQWKTCFF